ncbi:MAG: hypothetical protein ABIQ59_05430 [Nocardioidaceae bacterium]
MSTHDEDRLSRSLHDRAGDVHGAPVDLADVQRSARGIQTRRRVVAGVAALAVVAVAVPVALGVRGAPGSERPVAPATSTPSTAVSRTPTPTPTPSPTTPQPEGVTPLTVQGAHTGVPAQITYLRGRTVVAPGADPVDLPATYESIAPYRGGWLAVQRKRQGQPYVVHIDASGQVTSSKPGGDRIVTSQDGVEVSWVEDGKLFLDTTNGHSDLPQSIDLPAGSSGFPVGFVSPGSVVVNDNAQDRKYYVTDLKALTEIHGVLGVRATDQALGRLGAQVSYDSHDGTSCWKVATNTGGDREPKTCDWTIESFSADGAHFVGYPSGIDGLGSATVGLLDSATARRVASFDRQGDGVTYVSDAAWEDEAHVLASLHDGDQWYLVRLGLDGSLQKVDEAPGSADESPFRFAAHS